MKKLVTIFDALKVATDAGFNGMHSPFRAGRNVVPLLYLKSKNPRNLLMCKGYRFVLVGATGFEPVTLCL